MKTFVYIGTSLDGFIAKQDGDVDWIVEYANDEVNQAYVEFSSQIDAIVMGRNTFEKVITFPEWYYKQHVYVLSNTLKEIPETLKDKASIVSMPPAELLKHLSDKGYKGLYIDGGKVIQSFLKENLIDELIVSIAPLLLGSGISLFGELGRELHFSHKRSVTFSNGLVTNYYIRKN
ncbi:dihydrofolate reductase family protein [Pseudoflavitalea sp. G-6-1-2]|uniref:dihydrofolate reductase family protein n=1 Tax=Pseudoflavitalea sp. G-6-1-2 TaxID=2728841 RepID=UPI00146E96C6|nr:dihydrofolate reductase family protein [Pseudoflavitalea sp. G-6-1-2]NML20710.1 dihydrofolate reductase family protein [Pseudoflavitalea sp. G-6-1-2]